MVCIIDNKRKAALMHLFHTVKVKKFTVLGSSFLYVDTALGETRRLMKLLKKKEHAALVTPNVKESVLENLIKYRVEIVDLSGIYLSKACLAATLFLKQRIQAGVKTVVTIIDNDFNEITQKLIAEISVYTPYIAVVTENLNRFYYLSTHIYSETGIAILLLKNQQFKEGIDLIIYIDKRAPEATACPAIELFRDGVYYQNFKPTFAYKKQIIELSKSLCIDTDVVAVALERNFVECCDIMYG